MVGWAVATARRRTEGLRRKWRAEVGPRLPGGRPRLLSLLAEHISFECLVFAEIRDGEPQRIDRDELVRDA
jgi:hypothetical protein